MQYLLYLIALILGIFTVKKIKQKTINEIVMIIILLEILLWFIGKDIFNLTEYQGKVAYNILVIYNSVLIIAEIIKLTFKKKGLDITEALKRSGK